MANKVDINQHSRIRELPFTDSLKGIMRQHELTTLADVTDLTVGELLSLHGFNTHHLTELVSLLEKHDLTALLKHST